jgi:hypothetical protein
MSYENHKTIRIKLLKRNPIVKITVLALVFFLNSGEFLYSSDKNKIGSWVVHSSGNRCILSNGDGYRKGDAFAISANSSGSEILILTRKSWRNIERKKNIGRVFFDGHEWDDLIFRGHKNATMLEAAFRDKNMADRFGYNISTRSKISFHVGSEVVEFRLRKTDEALVAFGMCFFH